ncbi:MAG: methionine adenosyltransferase [Gammaproteobacteria bacterium]|nr:methionine adenosyltransferase [Gammaproteobacteria bacterium]
MNEEIVFMSESVTAGHPDKLCDQISDAIVDDFMAGDPDSSVDAECALASGILFVSAHYASRAEVDVSAIARKTLAQAAYPPDVFDAENCTIMTSFEDHTEKNYRTLDIDTLDDAALGRITSKHQVTVFGYACDQTPELMPLPISLAHRLAAQLDSAKVLKALPYLLPDGKTQVGIEYKSGKPARIHSLNLVASRKDSDAVDIEQLRSDLNKHVIEPVLKKEACPHDEKTMISVNPEGIIIGGGPSAHSGLTGRKTSMDSYGSYSRQSGAALSGKDPWRIDRIGAYISRYAAKNIVAAGLAAECEIQLSYTIGSAMPVSLRIRTFGTSQIDEQQLAERVRSVIDFRPGAIVRNFGLHKLPGEKKPDGFYRNLAAYGHMGRPELDLPWERTDRIDELKP